MEKGEPQRREGEENKSGRPRGRGRKIRSQRRKANKGVRGQQRAGEASNQPNRQLLLRDVILFPSSHQAGQSPDPAVEPVKTVKPAENKLSKNLR